MDVDLFGSFWNAQLPRYVSWRPQPEAMAVNAFSVNWGGGFYRIRVTSFLHDTEMSRKDKMKRW
jgi:hypothetical protein